MSCAVVLACLRVTSVAQIARAEEGLEPYAGLVRDLGDDSFERRLAAHQQLRKLGSKAVAVLRASADHPDAEIRTRVRMLLRFAVKAEQSRLVDDALNHPELLPGWGEYRDVVGDTKQTRLLFQKMQRRELLLFRYFKTRHERPRAFAGHLNDRAAYLLYSHKDANELAKMWPSVCAMLLATATPNDATLAPANSVVSFASSSQFRNEATSDAQKVPIQKLISNWVIRRRDIDAYQRMSLANRYNLAAALEPSKDMLKNGAPSPSQLRYAVMATARFGAAEHIPLLETLFENKSRITASQKNGKEISRLELRDVALGAAILLSGMDPKPFGFTQRTSTSDARYVFPMNSAGFESDKARDAAFERWKQRPRSNPSTK